ncbi:MAG: hypothetical protein HZC13_00855 [Nitrospirae bacterium]|nr:hypothetical protein [Nitrospirota bacterium]MBI5096055.1 hypothetical protein [Nitrospirota bacterium]
MRLLSAVIQVTLYKRFAAAWVIPALLLMNLSVYAACLPAVRIVSSQPAARSKDADPAAPIIITWDKTVHTLPAGTHDHKPMLGSINMAGGRYGLGTLLTTEWGVGGQVAWDGDKEIITPEAPLEPGTQYRVWTYVYTSGSEVCPANGGEIVFVTAGNPPEDNRPVRKFDLTTLYHGNETGSGKIEGEIAAIDNDLHVITVKEGMLKKVNVVLYEGIMVMKGGNPGSPSDLKVGDAIKGEFMGGRLYMITVGQ